MTAALTDDEQRFKPRSLRQARSLYRALVPVCPEPSTARNIVMWLVMLPATHPPMARAQRNRYRRTLRQLGAPPWERADAVDIDADEDTSAA
jgi:hypothetical protein